MSMLPIVWDSSTQELVALEDYGGSTVSRRTVDLDKQLILALKYNPQVVEEAVSNVLQQKQLAVSELEKKLSALPLLEMQQTLEAALNLRKDMNLLQTEVANLTSAYAVWNTQINSRVETAEKGTILALEHIKQFRESLSSLSAELKAAAKIGDSQAFDLILEKIIQQSANTETK